MKTSFKQELPFYLCTFFTTSLILSWLIYLPNFSLYVPFNYEGDAIFTGAIIKTIVDTGWYLNNNLLGAPFSYSLMDFPLNEGTNMLLIKFLSLFSQNHAFILNVFYLLTYLLIALISAFAFRCLGLRKPHAFAASILFTFIPYHVMRGEGHLFLSAYYAIPIYVLFVFSLFNQEKNQAHTIGQSLLYFIILVLAASSGIYYAFFACFFLLVAGILAAIDAKDKGPVLKASLLISIIFCTMLINLSPNILYYKKMGRNQLVANRQSFESELFGLKLTQLFLPVTNYGSAKVQHIRSKYYETAPLVNENSMVALGAVAGMGFLMLLGMVFLRRTPPNVTLFNLSRLNMAALLLSTIGGFGAIFAYTITPKIRCYNRISIFIAFFSLCTFFLILQTVLAKDRFSFLRRFEIPLVLFIVTFGVLDQVSLHPGKIDFSSEFNSDHQFVATIEKTVPKNGLIFQLPVASFPESPPIHHMTDYSHFRGYLHSNTLHWSYGVMRGRQHATWQASLAAKPMNDFIDELIYAGFTGLYINRNGYPDNGKAIEKQLSTLLVQQPMVSTNKKLMFYNLQPRALTLRHAMGMKQWKIHLAQAQEMKDNL